LNRLQQEKEAKEKLETQNKRLAKTIQNLNVKVSEAADAQQKMVELDKFNEQLYNELMVAEQRNRELQANCGNAHGSVGVGNDDDVNEDYDDGTYNAALIHKPLTDFADDRTQDLQTDESATTIQNILGNLSIDDLFTKGL